MGTLPLLISMVVGVLGQAVIDLFLLGLELSILMLPTCPFSIFWFILFTNFGLVGSTCPHCFGNFMSCTFDTDSKCPAIVDVTNNAAVIAAGSGILTLAKLIKPRFMRLFSRVHLDTILTLASRKEPGEAFDITEDTTGTQLLMAIQNGRTTMEMAIFKLCELMDTETNATKRAVLKNRMDCMKTASDIRAKLPSGAFTGLYDTGVLTFMWAKVSEFVMSKSMQVKLHVEGVKPSSSDSTSASDLSAKVVRPSSMEEFGEMLNLYTMYLHGLGVCSALLITDFFEHAVYDSIRQRGESWEFAHELMIIMLRRVEDSGGKLNLGTVYNELYLNTVMDEARHNVTLFFRSHGGNPGNNNKNKGIESESKSFNKKFTSTGKPCPAFNLQKDHSAAILHPNGTCKFNHVCDHWVSNKGKNGRCLGTAGTKGHCRATCDNPHKCDAPVP